LIDFLKKIGFYLKNKKTVYFIDSEDDVDFLIYSLNDIKIIGIDTEFDWRTTYFPVLSLIQIATTNKIFLIDCLKCKKLEKLKSILEDQERLIIFHSSRSDATVLYTNLKLKVKNVYDIQAAEKIISGGDTKNYASLVKKYFNFSLIKSETNSNWLKRPLSNDQIEYAADDVNFLIEIYKKQIKILKKLSLDKKAFEYSIKESSLGNQDLHVTRLKKLKNASKLTKSIFIWREKYARKKNIPPSYIFRDNKLKELTNEIRSKNMNKKNLIKFFRDKDDLDAFLKEMALR
jgi:ribonuclease D